MDGKGRVGEDGWQRVEQCKSQRGTSPNFFFTGFPNSWNEEALRKMFGKFGKVFSIYVARNKKPGRGLDLGL